MAETPVSLLEKIWNWINGDEGFNIGSEEVFDQMDATTGWSVLTSDTTTLATSTIHVTGTNSLSFAKVDGAANGTTAGISRTIGARNLVNYDIHAVIDAVVRVTSIAVIDYFFVRLGTDSSNYNEWRVSADDVIINEWNVLSMAIGNSNPVGSTGNGWDPKSVTYLAVGAEFDAQADALAAILFDHVAIHTSVHSTATITSEITSVVNTADVGIEAGENHIGSMGGKTGIVASSLIMSVAGAYTTGDYIGRSTTPQSFAGIMRTNGGTGVVKSLVINDKLTTAAVDMELWLFSITYTAPTDNAAWSISDADNTNCIGVISIPASRWKASALNKTYTDDSIALPVTTAAQDIFYALVARGTTPTWATLDLQLTLTILQD